MRQAVLGDVDLAGMTSELVSLQLHYCSVPYLPQNNSHRMQDVTASHSTNSDSTDTSSDPVDFWVKLKIFVADSMKHSIWTWQSHKGVWWGES